MTVPLTPTCLNDAASTVGIHPDVLWATAMVEQGTIGHTVDVKGIPHDDIGFFQINEINLPELEQFGLTRDVILHDGCMNALGAAYLMRNRVTSQHCTPIGETPELRYVYRLACYHSWNDGPRKVYGKKLLEAFNLLLSNTGGAHGY